MFESLKRNAKYLVIVDLDQVVPDSVEKKLYEAGISATVLGLPGGGRDVVISEITGKSKPMLKTAKKKRHISEAGRERIAAAQKKQ